MFAHTHAAAMDAGTSARGAERIPIERKRCTHDGCAKWRVYRTGSKPFCVKHGGGVQCAEAGCTKIVSGTLCSAHGGLRCKAPGCIKTMRMGGYCKIHFSGDSHVARLEAEISAFKAREQRRRDRIQRDRKLRDRHFHRILAEQRFRCKGSVHTCASLDGGIAAHVCPWPDAQPTYYALELDHIVPLWEGGTDDPTNLQVLCSCCHAVKTALERPRLEALRILQREALDDPDAAQAWLEEFGEDDE